MNAELKFDPAELTGQIKRWGAEAGFQGIGVSPVDLGDDEVRLERWLALSRHGEMAYMARHGRKRSRPDELLPGTISVISARMDYLPEDSAEAWSILGDPDKAYVSRYALGRDYHKVLRRRLARLAKQIEEVAGDYNHRVFVDSAPVLEKALARNAGLGWLGKHSNLLSRDGGSWFFLGEIYTDLALIPDQPTTAHCGSCRACLDICPTQAIVAPYELDARRCISYLTIELRGAIPDEYRSMIGNRVYGCDDCQLACPWNKFAQFGREEDFTPRHKLDDTALVDLFAWTEKEFLDKTKGSAIRRIGYDCWLRNLAVALGNAPSHPAVLGALESRRDHPSELVREHVEWAIRRHRNSAESGKK